MERSLSLKRETLSALTTDDLRVVAGGASDTCYTCLDCIHFVSSIDAPTHCCDTIPTFHGAAC